MHKKGFGLRAQITVVLLSLVILIVIIMSYFMMDLTMNLINRYLMDTEIITWKEILIENTELFVIMILPVFLSIGLVLISIFILSSGIVKPVNHLLGKAEEIRDSADNRELKNFKVNIKSQDEISNLAGVVSQIGEGLYKAALVSMELTVGKYVHKQFLPLKKDEQGFKTSIAKKETSSIEFFGYYEGAKGVTGDYFDFLEIDYGRFAAIKCDISGRGVSSSLIMASVATLFHAFFNNWKRDNEKRKKIAIQKKIKFKPDIPQIDQLVYSVNEIMESMGFKGQFAAFIIVYIDTVTGKTRFCNAGDNLVHIYKQSKGSMDIHIIPEAPAAGVFPNDMLETEAGFQVVPYQMDPGDILFLLTDGIEEAQRHFRNSESKIVSFKDNEKNYDSNFEEFGAARMHNIINSVLNRENYELIKYHNEAFNEKFSFNFSSCKGDLNEAVLAVISVERVFRIYHDPSAGIRDKITIDENVVEFLEEHFDQFNRYFHHRLEQENGSHDITFTHIKEDGQFDDLTILGVKRKYASENIAESAQENGEMEGLEIINDHVADDENLEELEVVEEDNY